MVKKFVNMFFASADEHLALLCQAVTEGDVEQMRTKTHAIKGSSGNVGACALSAAAADFEKAVREGKSDEYQKMLDCIKQQYRLFEEASNRNI